ncbi:MAG: hypothetical protein R3300_11245, partial [Candidatus Promineifilaceae bacterium]|nr:hypothetical protein [Candidatus Promineifilaceae bacterium]
MTNQPFNSRKGLLAIIVTLLAFLLVVSITLVEGSSPRTTSDLYWTYPSPDATGTTTLVRTKNGIEGSIRAEGLRPGNAVTGWFIVFNHPENCLPDPYDCGPDDIFLEGYAPGHGPAQADFFVMSGHVIGDDGKGTFSGRLAVDDLRGSGLAEVACDQQNPDCTVGLTNPEGALVVLATHDHGPKETGQLLVEQISSFLGGCVGPFNGNVYGMAEGPH